MRIVWSFCLCLIVLVCAASRPASAGILAPARASDVVTLVRTDDCPGFPGAVRIGAVVRPDGTSEPFTIPPKRVLVITAIQAAENGNGGPIAGHSIGVGLLVGTHDVLFQTVVADVADAFTAQATFPSGIVVKPGVDLCVIAQDLSNGGANIQTGFGAYVHGFLAKDK